MHSFKCKSKKVPHNNFYKDKWFLDFSVSTYFTLFKFDFVDMTLDNYGQVKTTNSKVPLCMVAFSTVLIRYKIFNPEKKTTNIAVSKL